MALPKNTLPSFTTTIPSSGELIKYVPFTDRQEKILLTASESKNLIDEVNATKQIIEECYDKINVDSLTSYDIDYLFLQLRIQSVSSTSELYFTALRCGETGEECDKTIKLTINLADIDVQQYNEESHEYEKYKPVQYKNGGVSIPITDSVGIIIKHPGFAIQEQFALSETKTEDDLIKMCIVSIYDEETVNTRDDFTNEELDEFYGELTSIQLNLLRDFIRNVPKVRYEAEFKCKQCGFTEPIIFDTFESLFI